MADAAAPGTPLGLPEARRKLALDGLGIIVSAVGFGFVYGLAARTDAGFSPLDVMAMSVFAFAGAAQFAAVGYVASGVVSAASLPARSSFAATRDAIAAARAASVSLVYG